MADWVGGNFYLTRAQQELNATYIYNYMSPKGWSVNAIAGMLGNMESESSVNPGIWQSLQEGNLKGGFGLVQWTPAERYIDWCAAEGLDYTDMDANLTRINWEVANKQQWIPTKRYPISFSAFKNSLQDPYTLGLMFLANYERPANPNQPIRGKQAQAWYQFLSGKPPRPPIPPAPGRVYTHMPLIYYLRRF